MIEPQFNPGGYTPEKIAEWLHYGQDTLHLPVEDILVTEETDYEDEPFVRFWVFWPEQLDELAQIRSKKRALLWGEYMGYLSRESRKVAPLKPAKVNYLKKSEINEHLENFYDFV